MTHSKRTMNRADVMYGVTMEEFGVSKPVGMRLTKDDQEPEEPAEEAEDGEEQPERELTAAEKAALRLDG